MPQTPVPVLPGAHPVTGSPYDQPHLTDVRPFGRAGLNLRDARDHVGPDEYTIATNVISYGVGSLEPRPTQVEVATSGGALVHSIARLADPQAGVATRVWGIDTDLLIGDTGPLATIDTGYSGDPLSLQVYRPTHSGQSWLFVGDRTRMRKVRRDGLDLPIGLAAPAAAITAVREAIVTGTNRTDILAVNATDGSAAADWTATQHSAPNPPTTQDIASGGGAGGNTVEMNIPGDAVTQEDYFATWGIARALDLNLVGARTASDDDYLHLWVSFAVPVAVVEFRLYFVVSNDFDPSFVPGSEPGINSNFYVKAFSPIDFIEITVEGLSEDAQSADVARKADLAFLQELQRSTTASADEREAEASESTPLRRGAKHWFAGAHEWVEFGIVDRPLRRGDFQRFGEDATATWGTVTGIIVQLVGKGLAKLAAGIAPAAVYLNDLYLYGGAGPDTGDPTTIPYDWRYTDFDPRTGDESNPSPIMAAADFLDSPRLQFTLTPAANGDPAIRQRFYRRGGTLGTNWFFAGANTVDGGAFTDNFADTAIEAAGTLELDHDEPVTTQDADGTTIRAQPVPILIALGDLLLALGDPYRPGHLYWCIPGESGHWPPQNTAEVCPPSEELMSGVAWGGQAYLYSRKRQYIAYPNPADPGVVLAQTTPGLRGLISRWALTVGERGIYGVDANGIWLSVGGPQTEIADLLYPLFHRRATNGYNAIDQDFPEAMRLVAYDGLLFFQYRDTDGTNRVAVYDERRQFWHGIWSFGAEIGTLAAEPLRPGEVPRLLAGGRTTGDGYELDRNATADMGMAVSCQVRTGLWTGGREREEKLLGDLLIEARRRFTTLAVQTRVNNERVTNLPQNIAAGGDVRERYVLDAFGTEPQMAFNLSLDVSWASAVQRPLLHEWGVSTIPLPEIIVRRATQWDTVGTEPEKYLIGVLIDCNTFGADLPLVVEYDLNGVITIIPDPVTAAASPTLTINHDGRHRRFYSWPVVKANMVRVRATPACQAWQLYDLQWIAEAEPPRIARVDSNYETPYDAYYTGLDLEIDTFGVAKTFEVYVDGALIATETVTTTGRRVHHVTLTPGYGHVFRYVATDANDCLLYTHRWFLSPQPSEQTNWNQGYTIAGTRSDKWVKGFKFEFDSFGQNKLVDVEIDGVVVETLTVNANGRQVVFATLTAQQRGRVLRLLPSDSNPSRLWPPIEVLSDEEPLALVRWETQEQHYGVPGFGTLLWGYLTLRSTAVVTWTRTITIGEDGTTVTDAQTIASTGGAKRKVPVTFLAHKGLLHKDVLTSSAAFYLYREESEFWYQPWGQADPVLIHPLGNDDRDQPRQLQNVPFDAATQPT